MSGRQVPNEVDELRKMFKNMSISGRKRVTDYDKRLAASLRVIKPNKKYRYSDEDKKLAITEYANSGNWADVSRKMKKFDRDNGKEERAWDQKNMASEWLPQFPDHYKQQKQKYRDHHGKNKKRKITRKRPYSEMEDKLMTKFTKVRSEGQVVNLNWFRSNAKELCDCEDFKASNSWLFAFLKVYRISRRLKTSSSRIFRKDKWQEIVNFLSQASKAFGECRQKILNEFPVEDSLMNNSVVTWNFDETACQFFCGKFTYDIKGTKNVYVKEVKNPKLRYTAGIAINSMGRFGPPLIIGRGICDDEIFQLNTRFNGRVLFASNSNAWNTTEVYTRYLKYGINK